MIICTISFPSVSLVFQRTTWKTLWRGGGRGSTMSKPRHLVWNQCQTQMLCLPVSLFTLTYVPKSGLQRSSLTLTPQCRISYCVPGYSCHEFITLMLGLCIFLPVAFWGNLQEEWLPRVTETVASYAGIDFLLFYLFPHPPPAAQPPY